MALVIALVLSTAAGAETPGEPDVEAEAEACKSCNARHTALQKLQEARKALLPLLPEDEEAAEDEESPGD
ncbi:hypothetical protein [Ovoidimarina sediminis]|uniref:hypothetical protein n=1 Tax=Ovoidimarina sediminis TaxID=3079856 RepID=UPI00290FB356|nr:hypothetical protein [Rhodophyticola sp. MJ-SS7]MDU8943654.1 hypothetical protein [Rhodophyticola sp. MJ-SS7]